MYKILPKLKVAYVCILSIFLAANSYSQVTYKVQGKVQLEDQIGSGSHANVKIKFYILPAKTPFDSTYSISDGTYSKNIKPGYYLVEFSKAGYVPEEIGGLALGKDTVMAMKTLIPGSIQYVSGNTTTTTWTRNYVYYVTGDLTVATGHTLTINPGVKVKFTKGTGLTCYGTLLALGTSTDRITFTSREATPALGDWKGITLNAASNTLQYVDYDWANEGIVGTNATGTKIDNCKIWGTLSLTAKGLTFTKSTGLIITNNRISTAGADGIIASSATSSNISDNEIGGAYTDAAIYAYNSDNSTISGNNISGNPTKGISARGSDNAIISNNTMSVSSIGIDMYATGGTGISNTHILNNKISGFANKGIYLYSGNSVIINNNKIISQDISNNMSSAGGIWFEYSSNNTNCQIKYNYIELKNPYSSKGIYSQNSQIISDTVVFVSNYGNDRYCVMSDNSTIDSCVFSYNSSSFWSDISYYDQNSAIRSAGSSSTSKSTITNNKIYLGYYVQGIIAKFANVENNQVLPLPNYYQSRNDYTWAIVAKDNVTLKNNTIKGDINGIRCFEYNGNQVSVQNQIITGNKLDVMGYGIFLKKAGAVIKNNLISLRSSNAIEGIHSEDQSGLDFTNNTIISTGSNGQKGVSLTNISAPIVRNNIIQGFQTGIYADNSIQNFNLKYNNFWGVTTLFSGTAIPPMAGQMVSVNANNDPSDIYYNINQNPLFVKPDSANYNLQASSKMINAGDPTVKDADSTMSDIGANPYYIYVTINHTALKNTTSTTDYTVNAEIYSPAGKTVVPVVKYRVNYGQFASVSMTKTTGNNWTATIPGQALNSTVDYYIEATEGANIVRAPFIAPTQLYSFNITLVDKFATLSANSLSSNGYNILSWSAPQLTSGTVKGYILYKSTTAGVTTASSKFTNISATATQFKDSLVSEGIKYYYRLAANVEINSATTEMFVSNEVNLISDKAGIVLAQGKVTLAGQANHKGIMVEFERTSPSPLTRDTVYTDSTGYYKFTPAVGIYNINFMKNGWQPGQLPGQYLTANKNLDSINMKVGYAIYVTGNVKGRWTNNNAYYVKGTLTVAKGDTLVIEPGTNVKFTDFYSMTVRGTLIAAGTEQARIKFTSGKPVPQKGDWGSLILKNTKSVLTYIDYTFANDGINGDTASFTRIENCNLNNLALDARGINLNTSTNLSLKNNNLQLANGKGIYVTWGKKSEIAGNIVSTNTTDAAIGMNYGISTIIGADSSIIADNNIDGFPTKCIYLTFINNGKVINNKINNFKYYANSTAYGLYIDGNNIEINNNSIISDVSNYNDASNRLGIYQNGTNPKILNNLILFKNYCYDNNYGIYSNGNNALIQNNKILIDTIYSYSNWNRYAISFNYGRVENNYINTGGYSNTGIISNSSMSTTRSYVHNNTIKSSYSGPGISCYNTDISSNKLINLDIGIQAYNNCIIDSNIIKNSNTGVSITSGSKNNKVRFNSIESNSIAVNITSSSTAIVKNNLLKVSSGKGIYCDNSSGEDFTSNTIISSGSGDIGIHITNLSNPKVLNNIVQGFNTAIKAEATVNNIAYNNLWNNSAKFSGQGLPNLIGEISTVNKKGTASDVYGNIFQNPQFKSPTDYNLTAGSALIDAGTPEITDLDGTQSDIGAYFYNQGYVPQTIKVDSSGKGFIALSWTMPSTKDVKLYNVYGKISTETVWQLLDTVRTMKTVLTNLTNNAKYDFSVSAVYSTGTSNKSIIISEKPGLAAYTLSTKYLVGVHDVNSGVNKTFTISNIGSKDLEFTVNPSVTIDSSYKSGYTYLGSLNGSTYYRENSSNYFSNSRNNATNIGGHLAVINSAVENEFLRSKISQYGNSCWIGYYINANSTIVNAVSGSYTYSNWYNSQPGYSYSLPYYNEIDAYMNTSGYWYGYPSQYGNSLFGLVEFDPVGQVTTNITKGTVGLNASKVVSDSIYAQAKGVYTNSITFSTNANGGKQDTIKVLNVSDKTLVASMAATKFTPVAVTANEYYVAVKQAVLDGSNIEAGDEIGLFSGNKCIGAAKFNGVFPFVLKAYGAEIGKDGFKDGDTLTIKIWDYSNSRIANMSYSVEFGAKNLVSNAFTVINMTGSIYEQIRIPVVTNRFNMISSYLQPKTSDVSNIFANTIGLKIVYDDNGKSYIPQYGINTIGNVNITKGYSTFIGKSSQNDSLRYISFSGLQVDSKNYPIVIEKKKFNTIGYLYNQPMDIKYAFATDSAKISIIQDDNGGIWIPSLKINTIQKLKPFKGYQIFLKGDVALTYTYPMLPTGLAKEKQIVTVDRESRHFQFVKTGSPYTIIINKALMDKQELKTGDEVAAYCNSVCVGSTKWIEGERNYITAWEANEDYNMQGFKEGAEIKFKAFNLKNNKEYEMNALFEDKSHSIFKGNVYSVVNVFGNPGIIPTEFNLAQNYPNPFNPATTIRFDIPQATNVTLKVYNVLGQEVAKLIDNQNYEAGRYKVMWNAGNYASGLYLIKFESKSYNSVKKALLIK